MTGRRLAWITLAEASRMCGETPRRLRRRLGALGLLRRSGNSRWMVRVDELVAALTSTAAIDEVRSRLSEHDATLQGLRLEVSTLRKRVGRVEQEFPKFEKNRHAANS
jgi:hypothetical protein